MFTGCLRLRVCFRYRKLLPSLQAKQFSAATGLSRLLIILGAIEPTLKGENVSEEVVQRQVGENTRDAITRDSAS